MLEGSQRQTPRSVAALPFIFGFWLTGLAYAQPPAPPPVPVTPLPAPAPGISVRMSTLERKTKSRLKDIAKVAGMNTHSLTGYGLVGGLNGSGDSQGSLTSPFIVNLLSNFGMKMDPVIANGQNKNVAIVVVTAEMPSVSRSGDRIDARVASLGDAKGLEGGTLISSLLKGPDGKLYASAQGPVTSVIATRPVGFKPAVVGVVEGGATVSQNIESPAMARNVWVWTLHEADYATAERVAQAINFRGSNLVAKATGPQTIEVTSGWAPGSPDAPSAVECLALMGEIEVFVDRSARVVCDQRTGTVVAGAGVGLKPAVVSHHGVTVEITPEGATLKGLVDQLHRSGATPPDIIGIIKALQQAGSLQGEVIIKE